MGLWSGLHFPVAEFARIPLQELENRSGLAVLVIPVGRPSKAVHLTGDGRGRPSYEPRRYIRLQTAQRFLVLHVHSLIVS